MDWVTSRLVIVVPSCKAGGRPAERLRRVFAAGGAPGSVISRGSGRRRGDSHRSTGGLPHTSPGRVTVARLPAGPSGAVEEGDDPLDAAGVNRLLPAVEAE